MNSPDEGQEPKIPASGHIKFYGLYWAKTHVDWKEALLKGQPSGWTGSGNVKKENESNRYINFWGQKGVYILYDASLHPVYAGQAGLSRKASTEDSSGTIGGRLNSHRSGPFRNGWSHFSWFGMLDTEKLNLRNATEDERMKPNWNPFTPQESDLNLLLASFEAVLVEGFSPRFNSRGGDMKGATWVNQVEQ